MEFLAYTLCKTGLTSFYLASQRVYACNEEPLVRIEYWRKLLKCMELLAPFIDQTLLSIRVTVARTLLYVH